MMQLQSWRSGLLIGLCLAIALPSMVGAQGEVQVTIDAPAIAASVSNGQPIEIRGWVVDTSSAEGTGIESVEIALDAQNGVASQPMFATYGLPRPDVAQAYGRPDWLNSGFTFTWAPEGLQDGPYTIRVWGHSSQGVSRFSAITVAVAAPPPPVQASARSGPSPTPTVALGPGGVRILDENQRLACAIDLTLIAPPSFARPCPGDPTATPSRR